MNRHLGVAFLCLLLCLSYLGTALAQTPVIGVSVGDTFVYNCTLLGTHNSSLTWDLWTPERNQSSWQLIVTNITGTRVIFQLQILLANGTGETFPSQYIDMYSGGSNGPNYLFLIPSNVNVNSQVYPGGTNLIVNDTVTRNYASGQRTTNHVHSVSPVDIQDEYNDKATGVLVEFKATSIDLAGTFDLKLVNSSLWLVSTSSTSSPAATPTNTPSTTNTPLSTTTTATPQVPEFPSLAILSLVAFAGLFAIALFKKANSRRVLG